VRNLKFVARHRGPGDRGRIQLVTRVTVSAPAASAAAEPCHAASWPAVKFAAEIPPNSFEGLTRLPLQVPVPAPHGPLVAGRLPDVAIAIAIRRATILGAARLDCWRGDKITRRCGMAPGPAP
jgi:hypothetical protein